MPRPAQVALLSAAALSASLQGTLSQEAVSALDLAFQNSSLKGFSGGFAHGNYGYLVPHLNGVVARVSLMGQGPGLAGSLNVFAGGFSGGFTDGTFGYLVPEMNGTAQAGMLVRFRLDTFTFNPDLDRLYLDAVNPELKGFHGGFVDPTSGFGYLVPYMTSPSLSSGHLARFSLWNFNPAYVSWTNLAANNSVWKGFTGGFEDGTYGYLLPDKGSSVVRFLLNQWQTVNSLDIPVNGRGGFRAGGYGYVISRALSSGDIVRFSLATFAASDTQVLSLTQVDPTLNSFSGGFSDGRYGYAIKPAAGLVARFNLMTLGEVTTINLAAANGNMKGFMDGFSDGIRAYFVPFRIGTTPSGLLAHIAVPPTTTTTFSSTAFDTTSASEATRATDPTSATWTRDATATAQGAENCVRLNVDQVHQVAELAKHGWKVVWARDC